LVKASGSNDEGDISLPGSIVNSQHEDGGEDGPAAQLMSEQFESSGVAREDTAVDPGSEKTPSTSAQASESEPPKHRKGKSTIPTSASSGKPLAKERKRGGPRKSESLLAIELRRLKTTMNNGTVSSDRPKRKAAPQILAENGMVQDGRNDEDDPDRAQENQAQELLGQPSRRRVQRSRRAEQPLVGSEDSDIIEPYARGHRTVEDTRGKSQNSGQRRQESTENPAKRRKKSNPAKSPQRFKQTGTAEVERHEDEIESMDEDEDVEEEIEPQQARRKEPFQGLSSYASTGDEDTPEDQRRNELGFNDANGVYDSRIIHCLGKAGILSDLVIRAIRIDLNRCKVEEDSDHTIPKAKQLADFTENLNEAKRLLQEQWELDHKADSRGLTNIEKDFEDLDSVREPLQHILEKAIKIRHEIAEGKGSTERRKSKIFYIFGEIGPSYVYLINTMIHYREHERSYGRSSTKVLHRHLLALESLLSVAAEDISLLPEPSQNIHHVKRTRLLRNVGLLRTAFEKERERYRDEEIRMKRHNAQSERKRRLEKNRRTQLTIQDEKAARDRLARLSRLNSSQLPQSNSSSRHSHSPSQTQEATSQARESSSWTEAQIKALIRALVLTEGESPIQYLHTQVPITNPPNKNSQNVPTAWRSSTSACVQTASTRMCWSRRLVSLMQCIGSIVVGTMEGQMLYRDG
jgi:hypothetical protein